MNVVTWSAVDYGHVPFVMALTGGRREVVQPFDLLGAQLDTVGRGILLDAGNPLGAGNRGVAARRDKGRGVYQTAPRMIATAVMFAASSSMLRIDFPTARSQVGSDGCACASSTSSIFLGRIVGAMFMRVNGNAPTRCARH